MIRIRAIAVAALLAAAGCGGSQSIAPHVADQGRGTLTLTVRIPSVATASHGARSPRYVSAGTKSISVADAGVPSVAFDVGPTAAGCAPTAGSVTCTFTLILPLSQQTLTVAAYDQAVAGGAAQGKILSTITTQVVIVEGQANALNVVLGGIVADLSVSVPPVTFWNHSTVKITVTAKDPDGYTIAGAYAAPIVVTYSGSNSVVLDQYAPTSLTDSSQVPDLVSAFGGTIGSATLTAMVTNGGSTVTRTAPVTGVIQSGTFALSNTYSSGGNQYGAIDISTPADRAGQPMVVVPKQFYNGTSKIEGVAFDPAGNVDVANAGSMAVTVHAPGTQITQGPSKTFALPPGSGVPTAIAADAARIYVLSANAIEILSGTDGTLVTTISGSNTMLSGASSIAVDSSSIYVVNQTANSTETFPLSASGNVAPATLVSGAATGLSAPRGITVDGSSVYVANTGGADVRAFPTNANGNVPPSRTLGGAAAGMSAPYALGFDVNGNLYVADSGNNRVLMLPAARQGTPGATQQILVTGNDIVNGTGMSVWPH